MQFIANVLVGGHWIEMRWGAINDSRDLTGCLGEISWQMHKLYLMVVTYLI